MFLHTRLHLGSALPPEDFHSAGNTETSMWAVTGLGSPYNLSSKLGALSRVKEALFIIQHDDGAHFGLSQANRDIGQPGHG